jgi:glutathione S-transferase
MMTLWHALECPYSMRVRLVLREKDQPYDSRVVSLDDVGEDVRRRNPKGSVPVLEDGDCVLYEADIIAEYLEERFPEPRLYPQDPGQRARARMLLDWIDEAFGVVDVFLAPLVVGAHLIGLRRDELHAATSAWIDRLRDRPSVAVEARRRLQAMGLEDEA